ncbi:MAG: type I-C CRISPR-associated protein Cas5 [Pyrinomonadaceae bacterium]|nr:type I-C CRISPR-associated protein Cas5 [Pyrinomonadaceae bacterium]
MNVNRVTVRVWGDYACFTRPEMKVERVSYPVMTPSAARGILEAIFWEPQIYYLIEAIRIVRKGRWFSFRRNEVISVIGGAQTWIKDPSKVSYIEAGGGAKDGTQRNMLALQDVEYLITGEVRLSELGKSSLTGLSKYLSEIHRRAKGGKCFHRPAWECANSRQILNGLKTHRPLSSIAIQTGEASMTNRV